ncbi:MAG: RnfABCDGE type electron transport complex subunit D [Candidatus Doudnabacteria bacterium]|nr:RnfABCDGE type electron transport complex subunit D [Candidatus Doudnabacteria bacterium]
MLLKFLSSITMYRLLLYVLILILLGSVVFAFLGLAPYNAPDIIVQAIFLLATTGILNKTLAKFFKTPDNTESWIITALILTLILGPYSVSEGWLILTVASAAAIVSKFTLVKNHSHIFNPAALGALVIALALNSLASWWAGGIALAPLIFFLGLVVALKTKRLHLLIGFLAAYLSVVLLDTVLIQKIDPSVALNTLRNLIVSPAFLFFLFIMLIEPLTSPRTTRHRVYFGIFAGLAWFSLQKFLPTIPYSLELSLVLSNAFAFLLAPNFRQKFTLTKKEALTPSIVNFWFAPQKPFAFSPGQFLEYTLPHPSSDARGIRRYFTITSSPTEKDILITSRFSEKGSSFKLKLRQMKVDEQIIGSYLAGDFILPQNKKQKLLFIAGGVGVTPFRSMIKNLIDTNEQRDIVLIYAARNQEDLVFTEIFKEAENILGLKFIPVLAESNQKVDQEFLTTRVSDLKERIAYLSGPEGMVRSLSKVLKNAGLKRNQIKHDYFPGY